MSWRLAFAFAAIATLAGAGAVACQVVGGIDDREVARCDHASLPGKPTAASNNGDVGAVVFALDLSISIDRDGGVSHGFDLDGVCSSKEATPPTPPSRSCKRCQDPDEDDRNGRDNGVALALSNPFFFTLLNETTKGAVKNERFHLLVEMLGWNGEANDPDVVVRFYRSHGGANNVWSTTEDSYVSGVAPVMVAREAWVRDGRLVARAETLDFDFAGPGFGGGRGSSGTDRLPIHLDEAVMLLPITKSSAGSREVREGIITGRWFTKTALASLSHVNTAEAGAPPRWLCGSDDGYTTLKRALCVNADIPARSTNDNKDDRCDAISIVFDATGQEGSRGPDRLTLPTESGCKLSGGGDWQDDCTSAWQIQNCTFEN